MSGFRRSKDSSRGRRGRIVASVVAIAGVSVLAIAVGPSFGSGDNNPGTFDPTVTFETSTTRATAHPDARITIDNTGNTANIGSLSLSLPDGFWGSLAAADKCPNADPGVDSNPAHWFVPGSGSAGSDSCTAANKIGTVTATATIDNSDAKLTGNVYLLDSYTGPADIGIVVDAKVGGVSLGKVRVLGHASVRGNATGLDTVVNDIPSTISQTVGANTRSVSFHLNKMTVDLISDLDGPNPPLLTNASTCGTTNFSATFGTGSTLGGIDDITRTVPYTVDGCASTSFAPSGFSVVNTDTTPGQPTGFSTQIDFPTDSASVSSLIVRMPSELGANFPAFGDANGDRCPDTSAPPNVPQFDPSSCPSQAIVGTVSLTTPLLKDPIGGYLYVIGTNALPNLGIDVSPSFPGNPLGVTLDLYGTTSTSQFDPTCVSACKAGIRAEFQNIPDAPVKSVALDVNLPDRTGVNATLSGKILKIDSATNCQPLDEASADFTSHSTVTDVSATPKSGARVSTISIPGCLHDPVHISGPAVGATTSSTSPAFTIGAGTLPGPSFFCGVDNFSAATPGTACSTSSTYTKSSALTNGTHRVYSGSTNNNAGNFTMRGFAIEPDPVAPGPAPDTAFSPAPPSTTGTTPSFSFQSAQSVKFQCSVDDGAFLPCGTTGSFQTSGTYAVASNDAFLPGSSHTFAVRAQNAEGTVDLTPASKTFTVSVPFTPTFHADVSTNVARSHPSLDVTITNPSEEKLKDLTIKLPDGFFGGLQGVQTVCPVATADAGGCGAGSEVGTVDTEAVVDQSILRISGKVYLTEARQAGDAAGLSIKVPAKIQGVDLGNIIVPGRLAVRGQAQGIDSMVVDLPNSIVPSGPGAVYGDTTTSFNLRKAVIHLHDQNGAAQPLLTNPSSCSGSNFDVSMKGYGSTTASVLQPFSVAGCDALAFSPSLSASIVRTADGLAPNSSDYQPINLSANLTADPGQAGIKQASILMPKPVTIDVLKLPTVICEQDQYETNTCPESAHIGDAVATSPLLPAGETLSGPVYILRAVAPKVIPRLFVRLQGRINISLVAVNTFENGTQVRSVFDDLPDAPLNSFSITVNNFLTTGKAPCEAAKQSSSMTGTLTGQNSKTSDINSPFKFNCPSSPVGTIKASALKGGAKPTFNLDLTPPAGGKYKKLKLQLGKGMSLVKKQLAKKLIVKADGKKLKAKCFKARSATVLEIGFCGDTPSAVTVTFKKGALKGSKKLKSSSVKVTATDPAGNTGSLTAKLGKKPITVGT